MNHSHHRAIYINTPKYDNIATTMAINHAGNIVRLWYPIPKSLSDPSALNTIAGFTNISPPYIAMNIMMAMAVECFLNIIRFISYTLHSGVKKIYIYRHNCSCTYEVVG